MFFISVVTSKTFLVSERARGQKIKIQNSKYFLSLSLVFFSNLPEKHNKYLFICSNYRITRLKPNLHHMPSKAALEAFRKLGEENIKLIPADEERRLLGVAENRVNAIAGKGTIFDEEAERAVLKFSHEGKYLFQSCHYLCCCCCCCCCCELSPLSTLYCNSLGVVIAPHHYPKHTYMHTKLRTHTRMHTCASTVDVRAHTLHHNSICARTHTCQRTVAYD